MLTKNLYIDMDGVLAHFEKEKNALYRFKNEDKFFQKLKPIRKNLKAIKKLAKNHKVYILSASPNKRADLDKRIWLKKHLPQISQSNVILCRLGENKAKYVKDIKNSTLIDDYTLNLVKFRESGGNVIKFLNKYDNKIGKHIVYKIKTVKSLLELIKMKAWRGKPFFF